jgi:hypothetical protein
MLTQAIVRVRTMLPANLPRTGPAKEVRIVRMDCPRSECLSATEPCVFEPRMPSMSAADVEPAAHR